MSNVKYIYNERNKHILYRLPISDSGNNKQFLIILQSSADSEALTLYCQRLNGVAIRNKRFKSMEEIAELHNAFFQLLLKNIDAVKVIEAYDNLEVVRCLVIDKESFYQYILPCMERI